MLPVEIRILSMAQLKSVPLWQGPACRKWKESSDVHFSAKNWQLGFVRVCSEAPSSTQTASDEWLPEDKEKMLLGKKTMRGKMHKENFFTLKKTHTSGILEFVLEVVDRNYLDLVN